MDDVRFGTGFAEWPCINILKVFFLLFSQNVLSDLYKRLRCADERGLND